VAQGQPPARRLRRTQQQLPADRARTRHYPADPPHADTLRPRAFCAYVVPVVLIWGEAITARNLLRGIKRRAEAAPRQA
jgi:hypothetical protein